MAEIVVRKGHDLRIVGRPTVDVADAPFPSAVGIRPGPIHGLRLRPLVEEGDRVKTGTPILADKGNEDIVVVSPATGTVKEIRRGPRRVLLHVAVETEPDQFEELGPLDPGSASREELRDRLLKGGAWPLIRQQPFAKVPDPDVVPKAIFISATETEPFLADPAVAIDGADAAFQSGLDVLAKLTDGDVHLTSREGAEPAFAANAKNVQKHTVVGPHPSGQPLIHAFFIDRVKPGEVVWFVNPQDVQLIGRLCTQGRFIPDRVVALAGNGVTETERKHYRTRIGTQISNLTENRLAEGENRFVSGGVLTGEAVANDDFLGLYATGVNVLPEGNKRRFLGWAVPGKERYSVSRAYASALSPADHSFEPDTNLNGGERACIQSGYCLEVCPTDVQPLFVWKAVSYGDLEEAEQLGIMDCVECGLCTFVCPSKIEIGSIIRQGLDEIEKEG